MTSKERLLNIPKAIFVGVKRFNVDILYLDDLYNKLKANNNVYGVGGKKQSGSLMH